MTFNLAVGLQGLEEPSAKEGSKSRNVRHDDCRLCVGERRGEKPTVLTTNAKGVKEISYVTNEDDEEEEEDDADVEIKQGGVILGAKTRLEQSGPSSAEDRERRQRALADKKERRNLQAIDASGRR